MSALVEKDGERTRTRKTKDSQSVAKIDSLHYSAQNDTTEYYESIFKTEEVLKGLHKN